MEQNISVETVATNQNSEIILDNTKPINAKQQNRRVGSFTMGVSLVGYGIFYLVVLFANLPFETFLIALKLAPAILVLLGLEILVYNMKIANLKLKIDIASIFLCIILIGCAGIATIFCLAVNYYGNIIFNY